jgi:hypothetical protein
MKRQVRTFAGASLTTSYQAAGAIVTISAYKLIIINGTTTDVQIQDQTTNDVFYVPASTTLNISEGLSGSGQTEDSKAMVPANTLYMVKLPSGAAGTGTLSITVLGF